MPEEKKSAEEAVEENNEKVTAKKETEDVKEAEEVNEEKKPESSPVEDDVQFEEHDTVKAVDDAEVEKADELAAVTVQNVQFASFDDQAQIQGEVNKNLDLLMDIKLQMTVELGRTELPIKKVLELTRGSIIELEKVAGEPVELYANGKMVALGEVVVIEDNFGLRITSITDPEDRLKGI